MMVEIRNWDMRIHRFKMMLYSIKSSAGPKKIRPEDGLPANYCNMNFSFKQGLWGNGLNVKTKYPGSRFKNRNTVTTAFFH